MGSLIKNKATALILAGMFVLTANAARAEMIRELVDIQGAPPISIEGIGIVTGLANTGDKKDGALQLLRDYLSNNQFNFDISSLALGNIAMVRVTAEVPPFSRPGQRFSVNISSIGDAKSLKGGVLLACDLKVPGHERSAEQNLDTLARATGQVIVGNDFLTRGTIPAGDNSGAMFIGPYRYGSVMNKQGVLRLNLKRPNWGDASAIARQINQNPALNPNLQEATMFAEAEPTEPVAYARDKGQILVRVPERYRTLVPDYIASLLDVPVSVNRPATILVNRAKNTIVVTGDIRVSNAMVSVQDKMVTIRPETPELPAGYTLENDTPRNLIELDGPGTYADLQGLIDTLNAMGLTTDQVITVFEQLLAVGAIRADLINE